MTIVYLGSVQRMETSQFVVLTFWVWKKVYRKELVHRGKDKDVWSNLWNLELPPKVKNFAWRTLNNGIPVKAKLYHRKIVEDDKCPCCDEGSETIEHTLITCPTVQKLWYASPLRLEVSDYISSCKD